MPADRIRELARVERASGPTRPVPDDIEFMVGFEQRYGGLWYRAFGNNGMEYGLDAEATLYETDLGLALPTILDGDQTWRVNILTDGRTTMRMSPEHPSRVIDSGVGQRIENHALLAEVRSWPHRIFSLTVPQHAAPELHLGLLPPAVPEATGPANRWWFDSESAVYAHLSSWFGCRVRSGPDVPALDVWTVWCFAGTVGELPELADRYLQKTADTAQSEEIYCPLCHRFMAVGDYCPPGSQPD